MIPFVNLRPNLEATAPDWRRLLARMHERTQYILGEQTLEFERAFGADRRALCRRSGLRHLRDRVGSTGRGRDGRRDHVTAYSAIYRLSDPRGRRKASLRRYRSRDAVAQC